MVYSNNNFLFGLELEIEYNASNILIQKAQYHPSKDDEEEFCDGWTAETDGSLQPQTFSNGRTVELITRPFLFSETQKILLNLKQKFDTESLNKSFSENISLNSSCGHHIHISTKNFKIIEKTQIQFFESIRRDFFKQLKKTVSIERYKAIKGHYFRDYAKKINEYNEYNERYSEFNLTNDKKGIEWRSFNILNCSSWEEYQTVVILALTVLKNSFQKYIEGKYSFSQKINPKNLIFEKPTITTKTENINFCLSANKKTENSLITILEA